MLYEVILDGGETPNKCTIAPLAARTDFNLLRVKGPAPLGPLHSQILLHHQGTPLQEFQAKLGEITSIATIDCVWNRLDPILKRLKGPLPILTAIPRGFVTAYPRQSKQSTDPDGGLATIEAIFTAQALLGAWDVSLFSQYYFGKKFILNNQEQFIALGVDPAHFHKPIPFCPPPRTSEQRRHNRARLQSYKKA